MGRAFQPDPVPLAGFLNPSAVSRQAQVSRPCLMPLPFVGFLSLQRFPLTGIAHPLSGPLAPWRSSTDAANRNDSDRITDGFRDSRASRRARRLPPPTMGSLSTSPKTRFPVALDPSRRTRSVPPTSPASKPCSSCESVRAAPGCPDSTAVPLLGFPPLQSVLRPHPGSSNPPGPEGPRALPSPKAREHDSRDREAPRLG
jgi:hypothetical protein